MKTMIVAACLLASIGGASAYAQNSGNKTTSGNATAAPGNPASAGESMAQPASAGTSTSGNQGTLMQQRQKAMSPQGASGSAATGAMKQ
ncbi:hypothetical protein [Caballeronia sp. dw_276]|uniref:hypothetical protein n=1 Tax=Caballeronia sp. dw_276 TaxID=2719795 RepID=UPI001BD33686|nr:hypothetical protein [Caballeronia sp. dw_276]